MQFIAGVFVKHPELALFLSLASGIWLGRVRVFGFSLGNAAGVLFMSAALSSWLGADAGFHISGQIKTLAFALFVFAVGYRGGPEFFSSLGLGTLKQAIVTVVIAVTGLGTAIGLAHYFHLDIGTALGLAAGGMTQTAMLGTGYGALASLSLSHEQQILMEGNAAVAYALTYILGTAGVVLFCSQIGPRLLRVNLGESARRYEAEHMMEPDPGLTLKPVERRVFKVQRMIGSTIEDLEKLIPSRISCERVKRGRAWVEAVDQMELHRGDLLLVVGHRSSLMKLGRIIGKEIVVPELPARSDIERIQLIFKNPIYHGLTVHEISEREGDLMRGIFLEKIVRAGRNLPMHRDVVLIDGDILTLTGLPEDLQRARTHVGLEISEDERTNLVWLGLGLFIGTLVGLLSVKIGGVAVTLGAGGGALISGLVIGWWNARSPQYAVMPESAGRVLWDLGLALFCAVIGLTAGPQALVALQSQGLLVLGCGVLVTTIPLLAGLFFGHFILKIPTIILMGSIAGSQTQDAAMLAASDAADSTIPVLGFTVPYAIANVLLTALGPLVVVMMY